MATEIEAQTIRWLAQFIDYPAYGGGLLLSGGSMANLACFLAARAAKADWDVRKHGAAGGPAHPHEGQHLLQAVERDLRQL